MKIFVTGGTGFIGQALIRALAVQGHEVRALARRPEQLNLAGLSGVLPVPGDLSDAGLLYRAMIGCRQVYHLAALARAWAPRPEEFGRTNITGTRNVLEAAARAGIARVVHTSTVLVLGPTDGFVADETAAPSIPPLSRYQETKTEAEGVVAAYVQKGLPVVIVSPSLVYGPGAGKRRVSFNRFLQDFIKGRPVVIPGDGTQILNTAYLEDVVAGHLRAMERGRPGERYILGGENRTVREIVARVNELAGLRRKLVRIPFWTARLAGLFEEARTRLTGGTPLLTFRSVEVYRHSWAYTSEKAVREIGYRPRSLDEGLLHTIRWLMDTKESEPFR
jgi:nucleoside-diphosphate-sugar epimerase